MTPGNYFATGNPYSLMPPPTWWLRKLSDFDHALVVFPSSLRACYVLARRRQFGLGHPLEKLDRDLQRLTGGGDGDLMADRNLVFVDYLISAGGWSTDIFHELRKRDIWAAGGADKYNAQLIAHEDAIAARQQSAYLSDIDHRARDAYRSYQARTGQRTRVSGNPPPPADSSR